MARKPPPKKTATHRSPGRFRAREIARVMRAAVGTGMAVHAIEVDPGTGKISVLIGDTAKSSANSWDEVLNVKDAKRTA
jgi:hypothetical protein